MRAVRSIVIVVGGVDSLVVVSRYYHITRTIVIVKTIHTQCVRNVI